MTYDIGGKLKTLRKARKLTLKQVAAATGFSLALISQVENNNIMPPIPTLAKFARVLSGQDDIFLYRTRNKLGLKRSLFKAAGGNTCSWMML